MSAPRPFRRPACATRARPASGLAFRPAVLGLALGLALAAAVGHAAAPAPAPLRAQAAPALFDDLTIHDIDLDFGRADWEDALRALPEAAYLPARLTALGQTLPEVGVRIKGNSSQNINARKVPLKISLDAFNEGQALDGHDVLNLNNAFADPTYVREPLAFRALRPFMPTPASGWARLSVAGVPFGLYVLGQRIEGRFLRAWFASKKGDLFQADRPADAAAGGGRPPAPPLGDAVPAQGPGPRPGGGFASDLTWLGEDLAAYRAGYQLESGAEGDAPWIALRDLANVLDGPAAAGAGAADALRRRLDVDEALWYLAGQNLMANYDSYLSRHNYFLYRAEEDDRFHLLAWDMNEAFGVFPGIGIDPADRTAVARTDPFLFAASTTGRPLIRRLLNEPEPRADYVAHYRTLVTRAFQPAELAAQAAAWHDLLRDAVREAPNALYPFDTFDRGLREDLRVAVGGAGGGRPVPALLGVVDARAAYLSTHPELAAPGGAGRPRLAHAPLAPTAADAVSVTLAWEGDAPPSAARLEVRVDGGRETLADMALASGAWTGAIPPAPRGAEVAYRARLVWPDGRVRFVSEGAWRDPGTARYTVRGVMLPDGPPGPIVLNELQADNGATIADPAGEFDDWIELINRSGAAASTAGLFLSDDPESPAAYALPERLLGPGERLLIWADGDLDQGPDHAPFGLSKDGETIQLSTADAAVDRTEFGPQATDASWARMPDATGPFGPCAQPSPGGANRCAGGAPSPTGPPPPTPTPTAPTATPGAPGSSWRAYLPLARR